MPRIRLTEKTRVAIAYFPEAAPPLPSMALIAMPPARPD